MNYYSIAHYIPLSQEYFYGKPACDFNDLMKLIVPEMPS